MQRALVRHSNGTYSDFVAYGEYQYDLKLYESTTSLCSNTECSPELVQLLNGNYSSWVLILSETGALLVASNDNVSVLAFGDFTNIVDWARDAANRNPSNSAQSTDYEFLGYLFDVTPFLDYLYDCGYLPQLTGDEELGLVHTDNGTQYRGCFVPTAYVQKIGYFV